MHETTSDVEALANQVRRITEDDIEDAICTLLIALPDLTDRVHILDVGFQHTSPMPGIYLCDGRFRDPADPRLHPDEHTEDLARRTQWVTALRAHGWQVDDPTGITPGILIWGAPSARA